MTQEEYTNSDGILATRESAAATAAQPTDTLPTISREDILRRIEEDRERHKKLRESLWVVPLNDEAWEFAMAWDQTSELCEADYENMREEMELCRQSQAV